MANETPLSNVKDFTPAEIEAFTATQLENYAKNLNWPFGSQSWSGSARQNLNQYKETGFPSTYRGTRITSRRMFLIERLKAAKQDTWRPELKKLREQERKKRLKEEEAREAAKPRVEVKTEVSIVVNLKDVRPRGHSFTIKKHGREHLRINQQPKSGSVGRSVCSETIQVSTIDFDYVLGVLERLPLEVFTPRHNAKTGLQITLHAVGRDFQFRPIGEGVVAVHEQGLAVMTGEEVWKFNLTDLRQVLAAVNAEYDFVARQTVPVPPDNQEKVKYDTAGVEKS